MPEDAPRQPLFAQAIEIPEWLEADRDTPYDERLHRDRQIAASIASTDPLTRIGSWWERIRQQMSPGQMQAPVSSRLVRGRRIISVLMAALGVIAGSAVALAVFHYDGTWPVNVVTVLASLVLVQMALVVLTLVLMLPRVPGLAAVQKLLGSFNPGALAAALYRRLRRADDAQASLLVWHEARGPAAARFARWQMLRWSQSAAVTFNIAALTTAFGLIVFTDLAFGWSTTLHIGATQALQITDTLSLPWRQWWPDAVPGAELIGSSRFYRLASAPPSATSARELTGWWPFLLASMLTYGLLPRVLLLMLASLRLRAATKHLLLDDPRVRALQDRMNTAEIRLGPSEAEGAQHAAAGQATAPPVTGTQSMVVVWSSALPRDAVGEWSKRHLQRGVSEVFEAGTGTLSADEAVIAAIASRSPAAVMICVRAWEAPLLDLRDFIVALRARVGSACSLIVVPVGVDCARATPAQSATWSRWTARLADPALYLESGA